VPFRNAGRNVIFFWLVPAEDVPEFMYELRL
jgi:hypothetical protein